ncbi:MAG: DnaA/Hda family protein, partial [Parvularculaceae bacterium]
MNNAALSGKGEFERFRAALPRRFGDKVVASWFSDLECEDMSDDCVVLSTGSQFSCDAISQRFGPQLKETWGLVIRPVRKLSIVARQQMREDARRVEALKGTLAAASPLRAKAEASALKGAERRSSGIDDLYSPVDERATFETFAVDETNEMAFAAARQIFAPGANADVTYLNGPSGVGKSHLLFAIANEHRRRFGDGACAYITYHALQNGTVNAVFTNNIIALQKDLLSKEVLLIDDIHLLSTSPRTQAELLNLVNAAMASGRRLVIAGELTPQKLIAANFNERLADRLSGGLSVSLLPGDVAHRARVLKKRLEMNENSQRIEDSAVDYIAENFPQSLREAIGALKQLQLAHIGRDDPIGRLEA